MPKTTTTDVVVIGGSLAGLAAATFLARAGQTVTLFEKAREATRMVMGCELSADGRIKVLHSVLASRKLTSVHFILDPISNPSRTGT